MSVTSAAAHSPPTRLAADPATVAALAIAATAAATLAGAWFFQLVLDIKPCPLCLEQRYAYYLAVPLALVVAFAPGAMDAMLALALTLHIDPIFVGAHHLSRFVFVSITTPGIVHLFGRPQEDVDD